MLCLLRRVLRARRHLQAAARRPVLDWPGSEWQGAAEFLE